jgi:hypothetical protein
MNYRTVTIYIVLFRLSSAREQKRKEMNRADSVVIAVSLGLLPRWQSLQIGGVFSLGGPA